MSTPSPADLPDPKWLRPLGMTPQEALPLTAQAGRVADKPRPLVSVTASAARITKKTIQGRPGSAGSDSAWQGDAWEMYDLIGEQRFLANVLAGRAEQARLFVGKLSSTDPLAEPEPVDDPRLQQILDAMGKTTPGRARIINRAYINYFIPGEVYLVGIPQQVIDRATGEVPPAAPAPPEIDMMSLDWRAMSMAEVAFKPDGVVELSLAEANGRKVVTDLDEVYIIRSWRSHPRRAWLSDSPTRSSLPVLRELSALTMTIGAQTDSRLAGAGVLVVPDSARKAMLRSMGEDENSAEDPFTDALIDAMSTAIADRSSAASFVPLVVTVPDESADKFQHLTFSSPFDKELQPLRDEAIRRLALGQDAPPELLLGTGGMNHWGAWLVREDVVTTHIEPPLALFCDSVTTHYLRPMMSALGYSEDEINDTVVWYDVSHMIVRPNRAAEALDLYNVGELGGEALRTASGFDENDAPEGNSDPAVALAIDMISRAPSLMGMVGLPALVEQIRSVLGSSSTAAPTPAVVEPAEDEPAAPVDGLPDTDADDAEIPEITASAVQALRPKGLRGSPEPEAEDGDPE